ncbi:hypothetical protein [Actomonas aquatica]|uniref:Porin n=1 Tax=Actomonas aquatica TaxID=2866162 RepID=A0ABZ1C5I7_9BACT|nr:hypothetical protein [Opitutus sp. WL0086]WRQ86920.1 hypothetical protein K1X11_019070 [Opitutus sp. WL0086]
MVNSILHHLSRCLRILVMLPLGVVGLRAAEEPSTAEILQEIRALRARLGALEALVEQRVADDGAAPVASDVPSLAPVAATPRPVAPAQPAAAMPAPMVRAPAAPRVALYGYVKADAFYETRDTYVDALPFWACADDATHNNGDGEFGLTAKESRFGAKIDGGDVLGGHLRGQFEFDFYGDLGLSGHHAYTPRTRHALVEWKGGDWSVLAGQTWETYLVTFPQTVNFTAYNFQGQLGLRRSQVRVTRRMELGDERRVTAKFALAEPLGGVHGADLDGDHQDDAADADMPVLEYNLEYQSPALRAAVAGFYGREHLGPIGGFGARDFDAWAVIAGGEIPLGASFTLRGSVWTGTNLDSAWGGIGQGINLGRSETIDATGGWAQLGWAVAPDVSLNFGYSWDNPDDNALNAGQRTLNESLLVNGFWNVGSNLTLGLELMQLRTGYKGAATATAERVQSMVKFGF